MVFKPFLVPGKVRVRLLVLLSKQTLPPAWLPFTKIVSFDRTQINAV
jgi:hypothetical protein